MVVHDESCAGGWGPEGQTSPCRCGDRPDEYCESCEADRLWETEGIQPVWASPTHTCGRGRGVVGQEGEIRG